VLRVCVFAIVAVCGITVIGVSANFLFLTKQYLGGFFFFTPLALAVASLTVFSVGMLYLLGFTQKTLFVSTTWFESGWIAFLSMAWFATGGYALWSDRAFDSDCDYDRFAALEDMCHELPAISSVSLLTAVILFGYFVFLLVFGMIASSYGYNIWPMSLQDAVDVINATRYTSTPLRNLAAAPSTIPSANDTMSGTLSSPKRPSSPYTDKMEPVAHPYSSSYYSSSQV